MRTDVWQIVVAAAFAIVPLLPGCSRGPAPDRKETATCKVERRDITHSLKEDGVLMASCVFEIYAEAMENLKELLVKEGSLVHKGDMLAKFNTDRIDREIKAMRLNIEAFKLQLDILNGRHSGSDRLQANELMLKAEQEFKEAGKAFDTSKQLGDLGIITTQEVEKAEVQMKMREMRSGIARLQMDEVTKRGKSFEIADLEAKLADLERSLADMESFRNRCEIKAPFDGMIISVADSLKDINVPLSELELRLGTSGVSLMTIADTRSMRVIGSFFEKDIAEIKVGQKAVVTAKHVPGQVFEGTVTSVGQLGRIQGRTATLSIEVLVDNKDHLLKHGLTAQIMIVVAEKKGVLSVPVEFVKHRNGSAFVLRLEKGNRKNMVPVEQGISDSRFVEIQGGLSENDVLAME